MPGMSNRPIGAVGRGARGSEIRRQTRRLGRRRAVLGAGETERRRLGGHRGGLLRQALGARRQLRRTGLGRRPVRLGDRVDVAPALQLKLSVLLDRDAREVLDPVLPHALGERLGLLLPRRGVLAGPARTARRRRRGRGRRRADLGRRRGRRRGRRAGLQHEHGTAGRQRRDEQPALLPTWCFLFGRCRHVNSSGTLDVWKPVHQPGGYRDGTPGVRRL
ncbi:hypothetical protein CP973_19975 [Streptomyces albofaciens JCM 4342]|nr:hypothetical protein CP973_19975 [Streptomyces albofaciens JCM 4342]